MSNRAAFLDRDGTIAKDVHYCRRIEDFEIFPGVDEAIRLLNENRFKVIIVTNQSGVARGYFTEEILAQIHRKMIQELSQHEAHLDAIYYCPHHPDENCECRKPKPKLIIDAAKEFGISLEQSYVVGDMTMDIKAGKLAGCKTVLLNSDANFTKVDTGEEPPDYIAPNLLEAVKWIVNQE